MKYYALLIFLCTLFMHSYAQAQATIPGYYVTNSNDTVKTQIKLPHYIFSNEVMLINFSKKVEVVDSTNKSRVFKVKDIAGFGFSYNENEYQFLSKDFGRENAFSASTHRFYQAIILGHKSNLFHRLTTVDGNGHILGIVYFLENPNIKNTGIYLFAGAKPEFIKNLLKQFYKDDVELHPIIDSKFQDKYFETWQNDIIEIVETVNKL